MNLEQYKEVVRKLNKMMDESDISVDSLIDEIEEIEIQMDDGNAIYIKGDWDSVIHRFDEDNPQYWYYKIDQNDEYALFVEGYYDSWGGSSIEDPEIKVGKIGTGTISYIFFTEIEM